MRPESLGSFLKDEIARLCSAPSNHDGAYPMPEASVECLHAVIARLGVRRVFEFGSGRSTEAFLQAGMEVTSLEDSETWLAETAQRIRPGERVRWHPACAPLERIWHRGSPFLSWRLTSDLEVRLAAADLVLIDWPALPPFREHALLLALRHARRALVVVDDANIPTVARYCDRIARQNRLSRFQTPMDHGLYFLAPNEGALDESRGTWGTLRAWRFFLARRKYQR